MRGGTSSSQPFSQPSECQKRKRDAVEVITNNEIEWESRAGEVLLIPVTVRALRRTEVVCRPATGQIFSVSCGHVRKERPRRLGRSRELRPPTPRRIGVGADVLAET